MILDMIYSTYGDRILNLINNLPTKSHNVNIIIVHQAATLISKKRILQIIKNRSDITYITTCTTGVTKSRNIGIDNSTGDVLLFCDDDVIYKDNIYNTITRVYENKKIAFATFPYSYSDNLNVPAPKFKSTSYNHSYKSILSVGTIEITCKRESLISNNIKFPEDMGAGTELFICDEPVFLSRLIKKNLTGIYIPTLICSHPRLSSGSVFNEKNAFLSRLLCFIKIFGNTSGRIIYLLFIMKNIKLLKTYTDFKNATIIIFNRFN